MSTPAPGAGRALMVLAAITGTTVYEFTWTIAGVAMPHMQGSFSATPDQIAWVMTSFMMGSSLMIACTGWLSVRFGRKRVFLVSIVGFCASLVMCATADTLFEESLWRFVQGFLGAPLIPLGQAITIDAFPEEKHGQATALWGIGVVGGAVLGPVVGGVLIEYYTWPWIFWLNVPLCLVAMVGVVLFIPEIETDRQRRMDWFGLGTLLVGVAAIQLLFNRAERLDWFASTEILLEGGVAALALYLFVAHSFTARNPFLQPKLFQDRNFQFGLFFILVNGMLSILPLVLLPLLLQNIGGYPPILAGGLLIFRGLGLIAGMLVVGQLTGRIDSRYILCAGFFTMFISGWGMSVWTVEVPAWEIVWTNFLQGVASGAVFVPITTLAFATLATRYRTEGFAVFYLVFFTGSAIGVASIMTVHTRTAQINHAVLSEHITPFNELFRYQFMPQLWDLDKLDGLAALDYEITRQATMIAYNNTFFVVAALSLLVIPLVFMFRARKPARLRPSSNGRFDRLG